MIENDHFEGNDQIQLAVYEPTEENALLLVRTRVKQIDINHIESNVQMTFQDGSILLTEDDYESMFVNQADPESDDERDDGEIAVQQTVGIREEQDVKLEHLPIYETLYVKERSSDHLL